MMLADEFDKCVGNMTDWHMKNLVALGIAGKAIATAGCLGTAKIEMGQRFWQPDEAGQPALIIPVSEGGSFGGIVDLVAIQTANPRKWWVRTGLASMLGAENVDEAAHFDKQLTVHATPLDWLRAECSGCCVIDWRSFLPFHLIGLNNIFCPDPMTGQRLSTALKQKTALPEIRVGEITHAA